VLFSGMGQDAVGNPVPKIDGFWIPVRSDTPQCRDFFQQRDDLPIGPTEGSA